MDMQLNFLLPSDSGELQTGALEALQAPINQVSRGLSRVEKKEEISAPEKEAS